MQNNLSPTPPYVKFELTRLIVVKILHPLNAKVFQHQVTLCPQMIM
ncbi:hypothetical protein Hanom_Chr11g01019591 [Helianthus anomalus]